MKSVLIVDDSKAMRMLVRRALRVSGYDHLAVREADNGEAALEQITAEKPDLMLCDWNMPGWSGIDLLSAMNRAGLWVMTIFVTSESTPQMHELARAHGVRGIVTKPFTPETLGRAISAATRTANARR